VGLGDVQPDPARVAQRVPEARPRLGLRLQRLAYDGRRDAVVDEAADGRAQVFVVVSDPDRHGPIVARA